MILVWLIAILLVAGILAEISGRISTLWPRVISLAAVLIDFAIALILWRENSAGITLATQSEWFRQVDWAWVPQYGIHFHLAMDGLSLLMAVLTFLLGIMSVLASWKEIQEGVGFFHLNLMWILAGIVGVFLSVDLFLFYFMWELMLVPMYFLIAIWGHERRIYA
ncbi:MAG TPA: NADH-quinone oxidoreductase subunit M, partial [Terriglobia bacterium]|nr:NADH-quinone oxidoreductase subunit M [Terriglobia bacterium]